MNLHKVLTALMLICYSSSVSAQLVSNTVELNTALNGAGPGTTIILADGIWQDVFINLDENGSETQPITITAQNPGSVLMTGNSRVYLEGSYLTLSGLVFQDPENLDASSSEIEPIIELKKCDYCKIINNKIDSYNGTEEQKELKFKWILNDGQYNEIAYNSFIGKYGIGSIINDNRNTTAPDYLDIHHNYFANRTPINGINDDNDQDAIRIGNSSTSLDDSFTEVHDNFFHNFFGEIEVISNKSGNNKYYNNTFRNYAGTLALRHGNHCEVYNNYFIANDQAFSGGVRIIGENHRVYNNYIEGINSRKPSGSLSNGTGGINISNGRLDTELNGYSQVINATVVNNTFVNCDYALRVGTSIASDLDQAPMDLVVANNIMYNSSDLSYQVSTEPTGNSLSEGNIESPSLEEMNFDGDLYRLTSLSTARDGSIGNFDFVSQDILGSLRDANPDVGAEEFSGNGMRLPYTINDVGIHLGFGASSSALTSSNQLIKVGVCGGEMTFDVLANVDWTISEDADWITLDRESGSGTTSILATTTVNTTGEERIVTLRLSEVTGGENLTHEFTIRQLNTSVTFEVPIVSTTSIGMQDDPDVAEIHAYDNDNTTYWTGNPDTDPEVSITFDLETPHFLTEVGINFWKANERTTTFSIAVADDAEGPFTTVIENEESEQQGVSVHTEQKFSMTGIVARYVKFIGHGNSSETNWTSIANVNIYGDVDCGFATLSHVPEVEFTDALTLYPMPISDGFLNIKSSSSIGLIHIYSLHGQHLLTQNGNGELTTQIDVSSLESGVYIVQLEGIGTSKIFVS